MILECVGEARARILVVFSKLFLDEMKLEDGQLAPWSIRVLRQASALAISVSVS